MKKNTFTDMEYSCRKKKTKREVLIIPWVEWVGVIVLYYPSGKQGRPPMELK